VRAGPGGRKGRGEEGGRKKKERGGKGKGGGQQRGEREVSVTGGGVLFFNVVGGSRRGGKGEKGLRRGEKGG